MPQPKLVYAVHADPNRSADLRFGTGHTVPFLAEQLGSIDIIIESVSQSTLHCLPHLPPPDAVLVQCDGMGRFDKPTLAQLCAHGSSAETGAPEGRRWGLFVEICCGPRSTVQLSFKTNGAW